MFVSMTAMLGSGFLRRIYPIDNYGAVYNKYCNSIFLSLPNEIQQYNGELHSSDRKYKLSTCLIDRIDRIDKSLWRPSTKEILSKYR